MRNFKLCRRFAKMSKEIVIMMVVMYVAAVILNLTPGAYVLCVTGKSVPTIRISSLYLDQPSAFDIALEWIINILELVISFYVELAIDSLIYIICLNMLMVASIIASHLENLKEALLDPDSSLIDTKYRLQAIILMILKYNE